MRAKRHGDFRLITGGLILGIVACCVVINLFKLTFPEILDSNSNWSVIQTLLVIDTSILTILSIGWMEVIGYALITGMNIFIDDNYAVDYRLLKGYRLSHLREEQSRYTRRRTTYLYLVMSPQELKALRCEQRWLLWFWGVRFCRSKWRYRIETSGSFTFAGRHSSACYESMRVVKQLVSMCS